MLLRHYRILTICCCLALATLGASLLVRRQTALLPDISAAPRPTAPVERQLDPLAPAPSAAADTPHAQPEPNPDAAPPTPTLGPEVPPPAPPRAALISRARFFYEPDFNPAQIQAYLDTQAGPLKGYHATIGPNEHSFAEVLGSQTSLYSINPRVVLALIEQQSGMVTNAAPSEEQQRFMLGFHGENDGRAGWMSQLRWAIRELHRAQRDFPGGPDLTYADQSHSPLPPGLSVADYAVARVLAQTTTVDGLPAKLDQGNQSFVAVYTRLFGDPRDPPEMPSPGWPAPAEPFLTLPMETSHETTSFFDHDTPFLTPSGSIVTYRGDTSPTLSYDGHDGWDYGMLPPEPVLAAADGVVGSSGCATGPHLHVQVQYLGRDTDPAGWCGPQGADPWANHPAGQESAWLWRDAPSPCRLPSAAVVVDTSDPGFKRLGEGWDEVAQGIGGTALNVMSAPRASSKLTIGVWRPTLPSAGKYRVLAWVPYVPNGLKDAGVARYVVGHADGSGDSQEVAVSQAETANGWADLGVHEFDPARTPFVGLTANDSEAGNNVWYDAVIWVPVE